MDDATVVTLAESVKDLIQVAIDDPESPLGEDLTFNLQRVAYLKQWVIPDNEGVIRIRVATLGTEGATEESRSAYGVKYVIPVAVLRKLDPEKNQGESIDDDNSATLAVSDTMLAVIERLTSLIAHRDNWQPATEGVRFEFWTHKDRSNLDGLVFNPQGLSERRQFESVIFLHYAAQFSATCE